MPLSHSTNFESQNSHLMNANFDQLRHIISLKKKKDFQATAGWIPFRARVTEKVVKQLMTIITQNSLNVFSTVIVQSTVD